MMTSILKSIRDIVWRYCIVDKEEVIGYSIGENGMAIIKFPW